MANMKIEEIEGIGPVSGEKLRAAGIADTDTLLKNGGTKKGRQEIAQKSDLDEKQILKWVNMADLCRIKGVGEEYSQLLECAGVDTVKELKMRNAENLGAALTKVNEEKKLTRRTPTLKEVDGWISQAKELPAAIEY